MRNLFRLFSLRRLRAQKLRSLLTIFGTALGVAMFVAVVVVNRSVLASFRSSVEAVSGTATLEVGAMGRGAGIPLLRLGELRAVKGVVRAFPLVQANAVTRGCGGESLVVLGVDVAGDAEMRKYALSQGKVNLRNPLDVLRPSAILLTRDFTERNHVAVPSTIELLTRSGFKTFSVVGTLEPEGPATVFGGNIAIMMLPSAQAAFGRGDHVDRFDVETDPRESVDGVAWRIKAAMGEGVSVVRPESRGENVERMLDTFQSGLSLASVVALFVGMFLIYNTMTIAVLQRRQEIGTLRAIGSTRAQMLVLFCGEACVMGLLGGVAGVPVGLLLGRTALGTVTQVVSSVYVLTSASRLFIPSWTFPAGVVLGAAASTVSAFIPAWNATRVSPVLAMRRSSVEAGSRRKYFLYHIVGLCSIPVAWALVKYEPIPKLNLNGFAAVFVLLAGFSLFSPGATLFVARALKTAAGALLGVESRLARDHLVQSLGRSSVTVSALMVGVAAIVTSASYLDSFKGSVNDWIRGSITADMFVCSGAPLPGPLAMPIAPELFEDVRRTPGVAHVMPIRITRVETQGRTVTMTSLDMVWYRERAKLHFVEGEWTKVYERMGRPEDWVLLSENLSQKLDKHVGDTLEVGSPTGIVRLEVGGVVVDYTSDLGTITIDGGTYRRHWQDDTVDLIDMYLAPGADLEKVRGAILRKDGEAHCLYLSSKKDLSDRALRIIEQSFVVTYALDFVAIVVAVLGVMNTLLATTLDRTREIGVLRAIGGTQRQVRKIFMMEAGYLGTAAILLGVATGYVLARVCVTAVNRENPGWTMSFRMPYDFILATAAVIVLVSLAAGAWPGRLAARVHLVKALEYE